MGSTNALNTNNLHYEAKSEVLKKWQLSHTNCVVRFECYNGAADLFSRFLSRSNTESLFQACLRTSFSFIEPS